MKVVLIEIHLILVVLGRILIQVRSLIHIVVLILEVRNLLLVHVIRWVVLSKLSHKVVEIGLLVEKILVWLRLAKICIGVVLLLNLVNEVLIVSKILQNVLVGLILLHKVIVELISGGEHLLGGKLGLSLELLSLGRLL